MCGVFAVLAAVAAQNARASWVEHYVGTAYDPNGRELYRESHYVGDDAGARKRVVLYLCPDGAPFARKRVIEVGRPEAPLFELEDGRTRYREGVRIGADGRTEVFVQRDAQALEQRAALESPDRAVIDAGFDAFIRDRWDAITQDARAELDFLVPSQLDTMAFVVRDRGNDTIDGEPVRRFRLELGAWYGFALPSIDIAYDERTRTLREYVGVANIRDGAGRNLAVRIAIPSTPPQPSTFELLARADSAPLDGRCSF